VLFCWSNICSRWASETRANSRMEGQTWCLSTWRVQTQLDRPDIPKSQSATTSNVCMYEWMNVWMNECMYVYQYIIFYLVQTIARTSLCNSPSRPGCPVSTAKEVGSVLVEPVEAKEVVCASSRKSKRDSRLTGLRHIYIYIHIIYIYTNI
jgi:hypothetical protein